MKKLLIIFFLFYSTIAVAQSFNNEWIDYSKTYYKFKIGASGLYRIPQSALASVNLDNAEVSSFQLWRNGQEVAIYTSNQSGTLAAGGYIEFWGETNEGKADQALYRNPLDHINNTKSLFTDTAAYFLTINPSGNNKRLAPASGTPQPGAVPEPYCMHTAGIYPNESIHLGPYGGAVSEAAISASFEGGEGWTSNEISENQTRSLSLSNLFPFTGTGAPQMQLNMNVVGNSPNSRTVSAKLNNTEVWNTSLSGFNYLKLVNSLPVSALTGSTENITVTNTSSVPNNRIKVATFEITYPRIFNFGGASNFRFKLPGSGSARYMEIAGFSAPSGAILYDLGGGRRYEVDVSNAALLKVYTAGTVADADLILISTAAANIRTVNNFETRNFVNYGAAGNQGDYLMITHTAILNGTNGSQPVEAYRAYRSSAAGGGYNAKIYLIDQLTDQFAYGIKGSPLSVRNFLRFARSRFTAPPKSVFILGRGVKYVSARMNESNPLMARLNLIPTFGEPASDVLLAAEGNSSIPLTPIGRVSVINGDELMIYLDKVKQYEAHLSQAPDINTSAWKKNVIHMIGADEQGLISQLSSYLNAHEKIIQDTLYGAQVYDFVKSSVPGSEQTATERLQRLMNSGINLLTYFGHSAATTLTYNLEDPSNYSNFGKYPVFHMMGCNVGDIFIFDQTRTSAISTISEKYLFAKDRGSIAMMAGTSFGYVSYLGQYNNELYKLLARRGYGFTLGQLMQQAVSNYFDISGSQNSVFDKAQCEEYTLNGDPGIRLYQFDKPDYVIEDPLVNVNPQIISVTESNFSIKAKMLNLGKAINRNLVVELKRTYPDLSTRVLQRDTIPGIRYTDSITYQIDIDPTIDKGANKFTITIDPENAIDELFENNNAITKDVFIYEDDIKPVYPYDLSIVNKQGIVLAASTGNPFAGSRSYIMEMDTVKTFNSGAKVSQTKTSVGGLVEFLPGGSFRENTVYYWRVAPVTTVPGQEQVWSGASFTYISGAREGFSQSHHAQFDNSLNSGVRVNESGMMVFDSLLSSIRVNHGMYPYTGRAIEFSLQIDDVYKQVGFTGTPGINNPQMNSLRFYLIDNKNLADIKNTDEGLTGRYGSYKPVRWNASSLLGFFQFDISTIDGRKTVMNFLDSIPVGYFVGMTGSLWQDASRPPILPSVWQGDTATLGHNISLYHKLKNMGLSDLDLIMSEVPYVFIYQKGNTVPLAQVVGTSISDKLSVAVNVPISRTEGVLRSASFSKAASWNELVWDGKDLESPSTDLGFVSVSGIDKNGTESMLINDIPVSQKRVDLSAISAANYPAIKVAIKTTDTANRSPYQLQYWRVFGSSVPEGAIAPNLYFNVTDTVDVGAPFNIGVAFKNVSAAGFDSLKVSLSVRNQNNIESVIPVGNLKPLIAGDTIRLNVAVDTRSLAGSNLATLELNPLTHQPEQYQFNNFISKSFYVRADTTNPYLDVTFDGARILNRDIISSKPTILMKLTDDSKYLLLNNTDLVKVQLKYPDGVTRDYQFNNDTLVLTPPSQGGNDGNTATVTFKPNLLADGEYELIVSAKDQSGNAAGTINYRIAFQVINKPMISNLLNYPNPFTSSTAFVFTLTGADIPQNMRIQILTVTGKIVREITKAELGPLRIGRNITEFKWDGTDQYGQKLANGVYLYRVLTNLNGRSLDKYSTQDNNTDRYFNKGYGKMVLIR